MTTQYRSVEDYRSSSAILQGKHAVVFGAGGSSGAAVAKEFAAEGAEVFLAGRTKSSLEEVTRQITTGGGRAHAAVIDVCSSKVTSRTRASRSNARESSSKASRRP
jgi:NADP-dependent 3-hydroxy acid dehydrogenase YdfG